jgi:ferrochelatase
MTPIHFEHLLQVVAFCQKEELEYSIEKLRYTKHFLPIFIDRRLNRLPSGKSDRVVIFSDNLEDITKAKKYIRRSNRWVKSIVLTPPKVKIDEVERCEWFESKDEAKEILKSRNYNYAFVYSLSKDILNSSDSNYSLL